MANQITKWEGGEDDVVYLWKSKVFVLPSRKTFVCGKVIADAYPLRFELYTDGALRCVKMVTSRNAFRLTSGYECEEVEVRLIGTAKVNAVYLAESMDELRGT